VFALGLIAAIGGIYRLTYTRQVKVIELEEKRQHLRLVKLQGDRAELESRVLSFPCFLKCI